MRVAPADARRAGDQCAPAHRGRPSAAAMLFELRTWWMTGVPSRMNVCLVMLHSRRRVVKPHLDPAPRRQEGSWPGCAPRRPRTTQIARTVSLPSLLSRWGVGDGNVIESPGSRTNSSNPTTTRSVPLRTYPNSWPLWRPSVLSGLGCATRRVCRLDELDVLVRPEHQPLPRHAGVERDGRSPHRALNREPGACAGRGRTGHRAGRAVLDGGAGRRAPRPP